MLHGGTRKIDVYTHVLPPGFYEAMLARTSVRDYMQKRLRGLPTLYELEARFRLMDQFPGYVQVIALPLPPIESLADRGGSCELARLANDALAELVDRYPKRFVGFVAALPMDDPEAAVREGERAVTQLKAVGLQIFTDVEGQPLDSPQFLPVFELAAKRDVPVWLHPTRSPRRADYLTESRSKYDIWWALGWPYETSICMARLVFSGVFDRWPELKILTHHMGGMVPYFEGRVGWGLDQLGTRTDEPEDLVARARLKRRPLEYFRRFYADTALYGSVAAVECGVAFFGAQRVLFGTDFPFDPQHGLLCIRETVRAVENATLSEREREMIFYENAVRLLRLRSV